MEEPMECNRTAAVELFEDSERGRYNRRARSLCDGLLLDQVGFVRDGGRAGCRAILFGGGVKDSESSALLCPKSSPVALRGSPGCRRRGKVVGDGFVNHLDVNLDRARDDSVGFVVGQASLGQRNAKEAEQKQEIDCLSLHFCTDFYRKEPLFQ
jgi:hypothetical protein